MIVVVVAVGALKLDVHRLQFVDWTSGVADSVVAFAVAVVVGLLLLVMLREQRLYWQWHSLSRKRGDWGVASTDFVVVADAIFPCWKMNSDYRRGVLVVGYAQSRW